jgi:hypothetical protein
MYTKRPDKLPFGSVSDQLEPVQPDYSELSTLFGDLPEDQLRLLYELKSREAEVMNWIAADPRRATLVQSDPQTALLDLLRHLRIETRELKVRALDLPPGWTLAILQLRKTPVGTKLMQAVWAHLNAAKRNLTDFNADPFGVVTAVARSTGATGEERQAVVNALSTVLGIATVQPDSTVEWLRNREIVNNGNLRTAGVFLHRK